MCLVVTKIADVIEELGCAVAIYGAVCDGHEIVAVCCAGYGRGGFEAPYAQWCSEERIDAHVVLGCACDDVVKT